MTRAQHNHPGGPPGKTPADDRLGDASVHIGDAPVHIGDAPGELVSRPAELAEAEAESESEAESTQTKSSGPDAQGRHVSAVALLTQAIEPVAEDMGFELLLLEWLGSGKRRVLRLFLDHPDGVSVADCSKMSRIIGNALDASEAAADTDPALLALLGRPYTLEVSSPGVDRPLTKRRHFADHVGGRVKLELWSALAPEEGGLPDERNFHGRIVSVEPEGAAEDDPNAPDDPRRGVVVVHDGERQRTLRFPLPRIRRANLVWEFLQGPTGPAV
jgi:ribosome maturation factor RimP